MCNLRVSLIQSSLHWEDKQANLDMFRNKIASVPENTRLIALPEMFTTGFSMRPEILSESMTGNTMKWLTAMSASKSAIVTGSIIAKEETGPDIAYYNRLVWMLPNGDFGFYDKRHLFAYGGEDQYYTAGKKRLIASVNNWKVNLQVCYDLRFPVWIRQSGSAGAMQPEFDLLVFVANWPAVRIHAWKTLLRARAIENQCYVIGVNRTGTDGRGLDYSGGSTIIGPLGEVVAELGAEEEVLTYDLDRENLEEVRMKFPFWRDADSFLIQT